MSARGPRLGDLSAIKLALMAKKVRSESQAVLSADPIAIVGMGCRVPGGETPEAFWDLLRTGTDGTSEVPADRWDAQAWFDADPAVPAKVATKRGGFLAQIDGFDAGYFGILSREADQMDPQQRLVLEVAIEALDDAGLPHERLRGSRAGVFVASYQNDYAQLQYADLEAIDARTLTGTLHSVLANRLSFFLDLRGPSLSVDTACSSSLVAIHLACQSLRAGESDLAIAGGVSLMITPALMVSLSKVGFMAPDGRCKTFDAHADGFGRGEGCGVVVLKRLSDAISDDDRILGVIRGSAVNQDGHSTVLAAPNGLAQRALIAEALAGAQLDPARIGYVEAHGTGTALGDPIEVEALAVTVGRSTPGAPPCLLGAAKANLGHLEAAAGVVGVLKAILALEHEAVPPQIHFSTLSPHIRLEGTRLAIPTTLTPWPRASVPRCAAVSSFGIGGTNAHVIVEEAPRLAAADAPVAGAERVLPISAQSPGALRELARAWLRFLDETTSTVDDLCHTASERRSHYDHRLAVVGATKEALRARLAERTGPATDQPAGDRGRAPRVAYVFSGQGPQWYAMGRELLAAEPVFRQVITECDALLRPLAGWSLLGELAATEDRSRLDQTEVAQPALFAVQVALAALWKAWGLIPDAVVGHSVGEIAALHVAGVLALPEAVRVVWHRGRIMQEATGLGRMAQVALSGADADDVVAPYGERLSVAAVNGPRSAVLSGDAAALEGALATLGARGVSHRMLPVQYAFHSAQMAPFQARLVETLGRVTTALAGVPVYSTVTGALATGARFDAHYFGRNVREPVRFAAAVGSLIADGFDAFVELGPHPVLAASIAECVDAASPAASVSTASSRVVTSMRRGRAERETLLQACAALYEAGWLPAWAAMAHPGNVVSLPAYPWQRKRHWIRPQPQVTRGATGGHPLLGRRLHAAGISARIFEGSSAGAQAWIGDHRVFDRLIVPGAGVLETFFAAGQAVLGPSAEVTAFAMDRPLFVPEAGQPSVRWQTVATLAESSRADLVLYEASDEGAADEPAWRRIASASASSGARRIVAANTEGGATFEPVDLEAVYGRFAALGIAFGPTFRCLREVRRGDGYAEGWVELPAGLEAEAARHVVHPVMLDAGLQLCSLAARAGAAGALPAEVLLPLGADRLRIGRPAPVRMLVRAWVRDAGPGGSLTADVTYEARDGQQVVVVAAIDGMRFARAERGAFTERGASAEGLYDLAWHRVAASSPTTPREPVREGDVWLVLADQSGFGHRVARDLAAAGDLCCIVSVGAAFAQISSDTWVLNPADPAQFARLLAETTHTEKRALRGVLHLWSLDVAPLDGDAAAPAPERTPDEDLLTVGSALHLVQSLSASNAGAACPFWVVTRGAHVVTGDESAAALRPRAAGAWGFASVVALEHRELDVRRIDLDPAGDGEAARAAFVAEVRANPREGEGLRSAARRAGEWWAPRLERHAAPGAADDGPQRVEVVRAGTLDGAELRRHPRTSLAAGEVRLRILASGINFRDVLMTLGMYPGQAVPLGLECAGVVTEVGPGVHGFDVGMRAFGFAPASLGTEVTVPAAFLAPVPAGLSSEAAAGMPVAFLTAYYGLYRLAGLRQGERVLVHAAAGGVGLAAVQLARRRGAEIFATAGSDEKRTLLRSMGVAHVLDSRSLAFAEAIRTRTAGAGVHVVLNSLAGGFIAASLGVVAKGGTFLELGKRDVMTPAAVAQARPDVRYHLYDLGAEAQADHALLRPMFDDVLAALAAGELTPLPVKVFSLARVGDAFRFMAQARHIGKIVVRPPAPSGGPLVSPDATYWITGGLRGIGLETARWLVRAGARTLVLSGRHAPSPAALGAIGELEALGAHVRVIMADAADRTSMGTALDVIRAELPPLRGVIHSAGVVHDAALARLTWEQCRQVLGGKARGAWILHELTRDLPLDFFVLYSAAGLLLGAPGQAPYAAANAELDALAAARRRAGLPALSVAWGAWSGVGMAAELASRGPDVWAARGLGTITPATGFAALERLLRDGSVHAAFVPIHWATFLARLPPGSDARLFDGLGAVSVRTVEPQSLAAGPSVPTMLRALPAGQRRAALITHLAERARQVIGLEPQTAVHPKFPLKELGLDSLMAVELRNSLARAVGKPLPATLLFDYPTLDALAEHLSRVLSLEPDAESPPVMTPAERSSAAAKDALAELSDQEAEALLLRELEDRPSRRQHG